AGQLGVAPALIDTYLGQLDVKPKIGTRLISISYTASDPLLAARIANSHVKAYIKRGMELHADTSKDAQEFLETKLIEIKARVEKSETALNKYRRDRGIVSSSLDDEGNKVLL